MHSSRPLVRAVRPPQRCAYCHDRLDPKAELATCPDCGSVTHLECVPAGGRCTSLACTQRVGAAPRRSGVSLVALTCGVLLPLAALVASELGLSKPLLPEYRQDGWFGLLYDPRVQRWTYPLLAWSFAAFVAAELGQRAGWIRVGLVGGLLVGTCYGVLLAPVLPLSLVTAPIGLGLLGFSPYTALAAFTVRLRAQRRDEDPDSDVAWLVWSLLGYAGSQGVTQEVNRLYQQLPTRPPDCYLATVAAEAAQRWVQADPVRFADRVQPVTNQLRTFKAGELLLRGACPWVHRPLRATYDRIGPPLARRLRGKPRLAAAVHVALIPLQAVTRLVLWLLLADSRRTIRAVYPVRRRIAATGAVSSARATVRLEHACTRGQHDSPRHGPALPLGRGLDRRG